MTEQRRGCKFFAHGVKVVFGRYELNIIFNFSYAAK